MVALSVVIPCFNEEAVLDELRRRLIPACESVVGQDFEIVLVDDGSTDATRQMLRRFRSEDARFIVVRLARNYGHQLALTAGLGLANGQRIFVIDADLQDPPELLGEMMARMDEGFDVVYGERRRRSGDSAFKKGSAHLFYRMLARLIEFDLPLDAGDFRLMSRRVVDILQRMPEQHRFIRGMISWIGLPQTAVTYDRDQRFAGETKYPLRRMVRFALDAITGFSVIPLKLATWGGFALAGLSVVLMVFVIASWLEDDTVPGWSSLMVVVLLIGSFQLVVIGILGEYVGRLFIQSKARPMFVIEEILGP